MKTYKWMTAMAALALLTACSATTVGDETGTNAAEVEMADFAPRMGKMAVYTNSRAAAGTASADLAQKLTRSAEITFQTNNIETSKTYVEERIAAFGGTIDNESTDSYGDRKNCHITARIPAERLDTFMAAIESGAMRIESKSMEQDDVTTNYIDLTTRLENKRTLEKRYKTLLAKATGVNDMLSIEREMNQLRSDIESTERQLRYLENQIAYSSCNIDFFEMQNVNMKDSGSQIVNAFKTGGQWFVAFLLALVKLWPFILLAVIVAVPTTICVKKRCKK